MVSDPRKSTGPFQKHPSNAYLGYRLPPESGLTEDDAVLAHDIASFTGQLRSGIDYLKESLKNPGLVERINPFAPEDLTKLRQLAELKATLSELELLWFRLGYDAIEWASWNIPAATGLEHAESVVRRAGSEQGLQSVFLESFMTVSAIGSVAALGRQVVARGTERLLKSVGARLGSRAALADEAATVLRRITREEYNKLTADLSLVGRRLSSKELAASVDPRIARLSFGKAIERAVADRISREAGLSRLFVHVGRQRGSFDFLGIGRYEGLKFEITTPGEVSRHLARSYGEGLITVTYDPPILP
jgi:hypothetical protein